MKYYRPKTFDEYFAIGKPNSTLLAGGTDLIPRYEQGISLPSTIIDVKHLPKISGIWFKGISLEIGASTTIEEIKNNELIKNQFPALHQSTIDFGSVQIRNRATIGGNICNASPSGDTLPALYAYDAQLLLRNRNGNRVISIKDFILNPGKTVIKNDEVLQTILIPESYSKAIFKKLGLR